jgi:hypothetical protein
MIKQVDDVLFAWVKSLPGGREPFFQLPPQPEGELMVNCYLLDISDDPQRHNASLPNIQPALRYLVTTSCSDTLEAHRLLGELLNTALDKPYFELKDGGKKEYDVEFEPAGSPVWAALHIQPRPAFVIRVPLTREWPTVSGYRVETVEVGVHELSPLYGRVVATVEPRQPSIPIAQALVEFPDLDKYAYTDRSGQFSISYVPVTIEDSVNPKPLRIVITAHEFSQEFEMQKTGTNDEPEIFALKIPDLPHSP